MRKSTDKPAPELALGWTYDKVRKEHTLKVGAATIAIRCLPEPGRYRYGVWMWDKHLFDETEEVHDINVVKRIAVKHLRDIVDNIRRELGE